MKKLVKNIFLIISCNFLSFLPLSANVYEDYIAKYSEMAVEQQNKYGIPASITLAQGLLESAAGRSTLAREGNNHFGIKCHADWKGDTMLRNDDAPDECFRVYDSPAESYKDHSLFLLRKRYSELFDLDPEDYVGWAKGLKKCGYATDPNYADRLISIIELYSLYNLGDGNFEKIKETASFIHQSLMSQHLIRKSRGLHYVIAQPGDTYSKIAKELHINKKKLMQYNDVEKDGEIKAWEEVYLQEKRDEAPADVSKVTIGDDESIHSVAQRYGVKMSVLQKLNPKSKGVSGEVLKMH